MILTPPTSSSTKAKTNVLTPTVAKPQGTVLQQSTSKPVMSLVKNFTSQIDQLSSQFSPLTSRVRFQVCHDDLAAVLESAAYQSFCATYPRSRTNYNSLTQILILECMTTPIHDVPQSFISHTLFTDPHLASFDFFTISSNTDFTPFNDPYKGSRKQPDVFVRVAGFYWPTLVVETGWSEDYDDLVDDAKLWLLGSRGGSPGGATDLQHPVNTVILIY